jgi:8-oxo-dGTP diphosphatase
MNLMQLKTAVDDAIEMGLEHGEAPKDVVVSLQIDGVAGLEDDRQSVYSADAVELHYDGNCLASGCVITAWDGADAPHVPMVRYVAGLLFSEDRSHVALIRKQRPEWQRGRLNGIGGHVEPGETDAAAMVREFQEETGATVAWTRFCTLRGRDWSVEWFKARYDAFLTDKTDEHVAWFSVSDVTRGHVDTIPNVRWLVMLAMDKDNVQAVVDDPS